MREGLSWWTTGAVLGGLLLLSAASPTGATVITWATPAGSTTPQDGKPVSAQAEFTTGLGTLTIVLQNLQANPVAVSQNVSDLFFELSTGQVTGSLISSSALTANIASDGSYTTSGPISTGWGLLSNFSGGLELCVIGSLCPETAPQASQTLIGPPDGSNTYSAANNSIANNGPHNPFLWESVSFVLSIPGVTEDSVVTGATFSFGTAEGFNVTGECRANCDRLPPNEAPEPGTLFLVGTGLVGGVLAARRRVVRS